MKSITSKSIILTTFIIGLLILSSVSTLGLSTKSDEVRTNGTAGSNVPSVMCFKTSINSFESSDYGRIGVLAETLDGLIVADEPVDEYYPSMVMDELKGIIAYEYQNESYTRIRIRTTSDYGENWSTPVNVEDLYTIMLNNTNLTYPKFIDLTVGQDDAFGVCITPDNTSYVYEIIVEDIDDPSSWSVSEVDYSYLSSGSTYVGSLSDIQKHDIVNYPTSDHPWVIATISDATFIEELEIPDMHDAPFFLYRDPVENEDRIVVFFPDIQNCANISVSTGKTSDSKNQIYGVCEIQNSTNTDLLFFQGDPHTWQYEDHLPLINKTLNYSLNIRNPKIHVKDNNIYIVGESDSEGIVIFYSEDYGESWVKKDVTDGILAPDAKPQFPDINTNSTDILCTFIESGNLFLLNSSNQGNSWGATMQINDEDGTIVANSGYYDIYDEDHIFWTDDRAGNKDIYLKVKKTFKQDIKIIPDSFNLEKQLGFTRTHNMLTFEVKNSGYLTFENVDVFMQILYDNNKTLNYTFENLIISHAGGVQKNYTVSLFEMDADDYVFGMMDMAGIKQINITIDPEDVSGDEETSNNFATFAVEFADIFPTIGKYPILEQLLVTARQLLGGFL